MARNYAALPHEYLEEMEDLSDEAFGRLCRALLKFSITGEEVKTTGPERYNLKRVFMQERRFQDSYAETIKARSDAGRKGAESRWGSKAGDSKNGTAMANDSNAITSDGIAIPAMAGDSKNGETKTKTKTKTETETNTLFESGNYTVSDETVRATGVAHADVEAVVREWNKLSDLGISPVIRIQSGSKRQQLLYARIRQDGVAGVVNTIQKIRDSDFLCGKNKRGWTITFDWFVNPSNFIKVAEGSYDRNHSSKETNLQEKIGKVNAKERADEILKMMNSG